MIVAITIVVSVVGLTSSVFALPAPDANSVLILGPTVTGGAGSNEAVKAAALGFTVVVVDAATWAATTGPEFATYRAIILGDPTCVLGTTPISAAEANRATWGSVIDGNVIILGTDPTWHSTFGPGGAQGWDEVTDLGIAFANTLEADKPSKV